MVGFRKTEKTGYLHLDWNLCIAVQCFEKKREFLYIYLSFHINYSLKLLFWGFIFNKTTAQHFFQFFRFMMVAVNL